MERLTVRADGQIQYELKNPFRNGTAHILFSPLDFLSKLAALVPRPRHNLVRYHGVFAPNARMSKLVIPTKRNNNGGGVITRGKVPQNMTTFSALAGVSHQVSTRAASVTTMPNANGSGIYQSKTLIMALVNF
ncbi:MAG TPA: hypothetical protein EYG52_10675 [Pseudomonadales bacterium]|nr:hypothetical protein [Pseudomonadales bacterium]